MEGLYVLCIIAAFLTEINAALVKVSQGWLAGEQLLTSTGDTTYYSFKGIPYAQPPVGNLRFMPPQSPSSWDGVRNATEHGSVCPQFNILTNELIPGNEDCLFLNVYTPDINATTLFEVLVYIHGGGYKTGSGNVDSYGPDFFIDKNVVVVTINYRLDALGFLCLDTAEVPGNAGMKDQVAALKWVQENIENFGGNPNNVTIMGQSAGGASVVYHLMSPLSKGLFQRVISMSGVPTCDFSISFHANMRPYVLGKLLGNDTNDPNMLLEFLQSVPAVSLVNADVSLLSSEVLANNSILKAFYFLPVVEQNCGGEHFLTQEPLAAVRNGNIHEADILFGNTNEETVTIITAFEDYILSLTSSYPETIVTRNILYNCTPESTLYISNAARGRYFGNKSISTDTMREFITYANEAYFSAAIQRFFTLMPIVGNSKIYSYKFSSFSKRNYYGRLGKKYGIYGAGHIDDCMYLFDPKSLNMTIDKDSAEYKMVNLTTTVFANFVKYGNPTPDLSLGVIWPEFEYNNKSYVDISNETLILGTDAYGDAVDFWTSMSDYAGVDF